MGQVRVKRGNMSKAAIVAQDYNISAAFMRAYLAALRHVTGSQYEKLLEYAGLGRYSQKYPPATTEIITRGANIIRLNQTIYEHLDATIYELFQKNQGREFAKPVASSPVILEAMAKISSLAEPANVLKLIQTFYAYSQATTDFKVVVSDQTDPIVANALANAPAGSLVVNYQHCLFCAHLDKADKPACLNIVSMLKELLTLSVRATGGRAVRFNCEEIRCAAASDSTDCYFLITRA
jgi:predicted hydrocarbon binding protein